MADSTILTPDLCIIGGGTAGSALALSAIGLGLSCVLVEKQTPIGRSQARDLALDMLTQARWGEDFSQLRRKIGQAVGQAAPAYQAERLRAIGVTVIESAGRFINERTLEAGTTRIQAHRFVLATGGRPRGADLPGLALIHYQTPATIPTLTTRPKALAVLGSTPDALALAQAFARLGSRVTLIGGAPALDPELWSQVRIAMVREGVMFKSAAIARIEPLGTGASLHLRDDDHAIDVSDVLLAAGLDGATEGLGLGHAKVERKDGALVMRSDLRTTNPKIFAIGDVLGRVLDDDTPGAALTQQTGLVMRAAFFRQPVRYRPERTVRVLRTHPPIAEVGLDEAAARKTESKLTVYRTPFTETPRARAMGLSEGHIKVMAAPRGRIVGVGIVGTQAAELIAPWTLAIARDIPLDAMASVPFAQPSLSDLTRQAALGHVIGRLRAPWVKRVMGWMKRLG